MELIDHVQVNVFEVVSCPGTDDRITLPHPIICTQHMLLSLEQCVQGTRKLVKDLSENHLNVDLLFLHGS